jgi:hypothetical protein
MSRKITTNAKTNINYHIFEILKNGYPVTPEHTRSCGDIRGQGQGLGSSYPDRVWVWVTEVKVRIRVYMGG